MFREPPIQLSFSNELKVPVNPLCDAVIFIKAIVISLYAATTFVENEAAFKVAVVPVSPEDNPLVVSETVSPVEKAPLTFPTYILFKVSSTLIISPYAVDVFPRTKLAASNDASDVDAERYNSEVVLFRSVDVARGTAFLPPELKSIS